MKFTIITVLPSQVREFLKEGIFRIAQTKGDVQIEVCDLRDFTDDNHKTVDDRPYGGGAGMILMIDPIFKAINHYKTENSVVVVTTPRGRKLEQKWVRELSKNNNTHYIILAGHYEGIDERVFENLVDIELSLGDFVLSGGELPALVFVDSIVRLLPNVLGNTVSSEDESFENNLLEYPQYTRPADFKGWKVPDILLSGNHSQIKKYRKEKSVDLTLKKRPDLLKI